MLFLILLYLTLASLILSSIYTSTVRVQKLFHNYNKNFIDLNVFLCLEEIYFASSGQHILILFVPFESSMNKAVFFFIFESCYL